MVTSIPLSKTGKYKGQFEAIVDDCDSDLAELKWSVISSRNTRYAYRHLPVTQNPQSLHRVILGRKLERELLPSELVDHIDRNGLNNVRSNLRLASVAENNRNTRIRKDNTSGYKGVTKSKKSGKWQAQISINGKRIHLGEYVDKEDAYKAYCEKALELHGDFAHLE